MHSCVLAAEAEAPLHDPLPRCMRCAAQVLAGALKDNGRATVAGERTFGKGLIQTVVELSDGSGVAITVARYQTPAGTDINKARVLSCPEHWSGSCMHVRCMHARQVLSRQHMRMLGRSGSCSGCGSAAWCKQAE